MSPMQAFREGEIAVNRHGIGFVRLDGLLTMTSVYRAKKMGVALPGDIVPYKNYRQKTGPNNPVWKVGCWEYANAETRPGLWEHWIREFRCLATSNRMKGRPVPPFFVLPETRWMRSIMKK